MKAFISNNDHNVKAVFKKYGYDVVSTTEEAELLVFTGGSDITPSLYGERLITGTYPCFSRDLQEIRQWKSKPPYQPRVGICRGAQLGNVLCGGTLWQDVDKHDKGFHPIKWRDPEGRVHTGKVNSIHHQMCRLTEESVLLATASLSTKKTSEYEYRTFTDNSPNREDDVEAFYYPNFNFFGAQWHPEYGGEDSTELFFKLMERYHHN
jgi:gamma-glutamyl-gamma-aminobutyrate hydrolase PuuD